MDEDEMMMLYVINDLEDAEHQAAAVPRVTFLRLDPLDVLSDKQFIKHFRLNKTIFQNLLQELGDHLELPSRRSSALDLKTKLLVTLIFYGQGSYQAVTGSNFFSGMSQPSVSRSIEEITNALNSNAFIERWIHFPANFQELSQQRTRFHEASNIPGGIGIIDCTQLAIVMPSEDEHIYINRKGYHSLNVQLICNEHLEIINANARFPGSTHDSYIWRQSRVSQIMKQIYRHDNDNNFFLLGDSGYPLRPWLMTPLRDPIPGTASERFNNQFKSTRSIIERCNGVLKNRFRCLLRHRVLHYEPLKASKIVMACVVLHNVCIKNNIPEPDIDEDIGDLGLVGGNRGPLLGNIAGNIDLAAARQLRLNIIENHFN